MIHYIYVGPVLNNFNKLISNKWEGETSANTFQKAISNLNYQFKLQHGLLPTAKIKLVNKPIAS